MFYAAAAESLSLVQGEIEELSLAAEGEYRSVRCRQRHAILLIIPCLESPAITEVPL